MDRELIVHLMGWKNKADHLPLLLRGARQVGKSYLVEHFGKTCFENSVTINFELFPEYRQCFDTLKPKEIINKIELMSNQTIAPGKTLLFLDEIQVCPNAIMALRYFREQMSALHVIAAGSLLEFTLREKGLSMPVGRVQYLYLRQLSFREYLNVSNNDKLIDFLNSVSIKSGIPAVIHEHAMKLVQEYMNIGGMPMVVTSYLKDQSLQQGQEYQTLLLRTYSDDFSKYAATTRHKYLQQVYNQTPGLVGQHIKYVNISSAKELQLSKSILTVPFYLLSQLPRLIREC
jgi:predicted AAA+ superfamily ATPase